MIFPKTIMNDSFNIKKEELEDIIKYKINPENNHKEYNRIIPLRNIIKIDDLSYAKKEFLESIIKAVPLKDNPDIKPYKKSKIDIYRVQPKGIQIGQTFALTQKTNRLLTNVLNIFNEFHVSHGYSKMEPVIIYGKDKEDYPAIAFYIPPIIENHNGNAVLLDGIHRSLICSAAGTTINAVHLSKIDVNLPFEPMEWNKLKLMDEKPPTIGRYNNLKLDLFRQLTYVGVDG